MADPPDTYAHIPWRRLNHSEPRNKPVRTVVPPRPPLRANAGGHRQGVGDQTRGAFAEALRQRRAAGIDPSNLFVLEFDFLLASQRDSLEKLGGRILDEGESRTTLANPRYAVPITFSGSAYREAFEQIDPAAVGAECFLPERGPQGAAHLTKLTICFADLDRAKAFRADEALHATHRFEVAKSPPKRLSTETTHRLLIEFPDAASVERFRREEQLYRDRSATTGVLTPSERSDLFDGLDRVRALAPTDRTGPRLRDEGVPDRVEFAFDVDLWHPGDARQVQEVIRLFRGMVDRQGGRVTDGPTAVAGTFLLARVKGGRAVLDAVLHYDRVALADLPPKLPAMPTTIFQSPPPPASPPPALDSAPLACVVDSGVLAGHPLLSGWVVDERDFDSGEDTAVDRAGHGTHVAGIVAYGDVFRCLQDNRWEPKVRILSAKVLRRASNGDAEFAEDNDKRIETQLQEAVIRFYTEYGCRVFNLSLGHFTRTYTGGRQLPWALVIDELVRKLNVVIVIAAGNVSRPVVPEAATEDELRRQVLDQLFTPDHALVDPASAMLALTVGSIARSDMPHQAYRSPNRPPLVGAPPNGPSPFTRCGLLAGSGPGPARAVKPELVAYGGNSYLSIGGMWADNDALLGEPSLNLDYATRMLKAAVGTSVAAPFVTHVCALVENELRQSPRWRERGPTANLIRVLAVHSARIPQNTRRWVGGTTDSADRWLRLLGYGLPDPDRAARSTDQTVVLAAEDELEDGFYHVYELEVPAVFLKIKTKRHIRVTLAYDPPVRGTRKEYLTRKLYFRLVRGQSLDSIAANAAAGKDLTQPDLEPGISKVAGSTVQSVAF